MFQLVLSDTSFSFGPVEMGRVGVGVPIWHVGHENAFHIDFVQIQVHARGTAGAFGIIDHNTKYYSCKFGENPCIVNKIIAGPLLTYLLLQHQLPKSPKNHFTAKIIQREFSPIINTFLITPL